MSSYISKYNGGVTFDTEDSTPSTPSISGRNNPVVVESSTTKGFFDSAFSYINSYSVMRGASLSWDRTRLLAGKLTKLENIGEIPVELKSGDGTCLAASHIYHDAFCQRIEENNGILATLEISVDNEFVKSIKPVRLTDKNTGKSYEAAIIKFSSNLDYSNEKLVQLQDFLDKARFKAIWESSKDPIQNISQIAKVFPVAQLLLNILPFSKDNILIISKSQVDELKTKDLDISDTDSFEKSFADLFSVLNTKIDDVIFFEDSTSSFIQTLDDLKINRSSWRMVTNSKGSFIIKDSNPALNFLEGYDMKFNHPLIKSEISKRPEIAQDYHSKERGVVVLSMNQMNSYTQYTHEILTFLLSGMDVFTYDNAGKGLSKGSNSEQGLVEAIYLSGSYLLESGYQESKIVFKGQCAGGIPSSTAPLFFPQASVWIDQSPNSFSNVSVDILKKTVADKKDKSVIFDIALEVIQNAEDLFQGASSYILPSIDIIENASKTKGLFLYSMGIPDENGRGGDQLVPKNDFDKMIAKIGSIENSVFLPIVGGTHVTDWWIDPQVLKKVIKVFKSSGLIFSNFESR